MGRCCPTIAGFAALRATSMTLQETSRSAQSHPNSGCKHELSRVSGQAVVRRLWHCGTTRQGCRQCRRGGRSRRDHWRQAVDGQGPDPRRWPRQGRWREILQVARRGARGGQRHARPEDGNLSVRGACAAGQPGAGNRSHRHRQGTVSVCSCGSRCEGGDLHRLGTWWRGHRAGSQRDPGRDSHRDGRLCRGPAAVAVPRAGFCHGSEQQADAAADQDHAGHVQAVQRAGSVPDRTQPAGHSG